MSRSTTTSRAKAAVPAEETWADKIARLRKRKPAEGYLTVPDLDALTEVEAARQRHLAARNAARKNLPDGQLTADEIVAFLDDDKTVKEAQAELDAAMDAAEQAEITFHFRALPPEVYEALTYDHPPTDEQAVKEYDHNPVTYVPALIAACSVNPLTADDVAGLMTPDEDGHAPLNAGDVQAMYQMCRDLNNRPRMMLGKGSRPTQD